MTVAVLGGTGRTGRLLVDELLARGHSVRALARNPGSMAVEHDGLTVVTGDATDPQSVAALIDGAHAVVSTLGPTDKDATVHTRSAERVIGEMQRVGVRRFICVSGAGIDVPGDRKSRSAKLISATIRTVGGNLVKDKAREYESYAASDLDWTLVRPPRLTDGPATGRVEHHAHTTPASTSITRADLAAFMADVLDQNLYLRQAPFVAGAR